MNTDLRKRLEEAAENYPLQSQIKAFIAGGEWMLEETIALAKEWMKKNLVTTSQDQMDKMIYNVMTRKNKTKLLADFESDINKLWEEKK